jgi:hypothetical protein
MNADQPMFCRILYVFAFTGICFSLAGCSPRFINETSLSRREVAELRRFMSSITRSPHMRLTYNDKSFVYTFTCGKVTKGSRYRMTLGTMTEYSLIYTNNSWKLIDFRSWAM